MRQGAQVCEGGLESGYLRREMREGDCLESYGFVTYFI